MHGAGVNLKETCMLGKIKNTVSRTDCYLAEMLRAMLKERLEDQVYLTQVKWTYEKPWNPWKNRDSSRWIIQSRPDTNEVRDVVLQAHYIIPTQRLRRLRLVMAEFTLTKESTASNWRILRVFLHMGDPTENDPKRFEYQFTGEENRCSKEIEQLDAFLG